MLKHYYVSPKKRTKSQSSDASVASEHSLDGPPVTIGGTDSQRHQHNGALIKQGALSFRRSPHSLRNTYPLFIDDFDD